MTLDLFIHYGPKESETVASAIIEGNYRYTLTRQWGSEKPMTFVMLNPSTADAEVDDPTIRRCMGYAKREGCGGIVVVNLFALRVTRPVHLFDKTIEDDPNGPENLRHVALAVDKAKEDGAPVVCAWGAFKDVGKSIAYRWLIDATDEPFYCLGMTADYAPRHPLYLRADAPMVVWPS